MRSAAVVCSLCVTLLGLSLAGTAVSQPTFDHSYAAYNELLRAHVSGGLVDYKGLRQKGKLVDSLVASFGSPDPGKFSREQQLAFYINAYNVITLKSILDAYPVKSIRDIDGVWKKREWRVGGELLTLDAIEHQILRKNYAEPRIHCAIVCASIGCPILQPFAFRADSLENQLHRAASDFARSPGHNRLDPKRKTAAISAIFNWFGDDFVPLWAAKGKQGSLGQKERAALNFLIAHLPADQQASMQGVSWMVSYQDYDWSLNERP